MGNGLGTPLKCFLKALSFREGFGAGMLLFMTSLDAPVARDLCRDAARDFCRTTAGEDAHSTLSLHQGMLFKGSRKSGQPRNRIGWGLVVVSLSLVNQYRVLMLVFSCVFE